MKKLVLTSVCAVAVGGAAFAQGTIGWNTINPNGMNAQTNTISYSPFFGGGPTGIGGAAQGATAGAYAGFYYELLYNTAFTGSQIAQPGNLAALTGGAWIDTGLEATNAAVAGRLFPVAPNSAAAVAGWVGGIGTVGGTTNNIMMVGWSANMGTSWGAVETLLNNWAIQGPGVVGNAFFGISATGYIVPNVSPANGPATAGTLATLNGVPINSPLTQLYLLPVPEPTTLALASLGGLSLLLFRRRK